MKNLNKFKGFTLVEVLIVIIIVGILIAALLPRLTGSQERARDVARQGGVNQLASAIGLMLSDHGSVTTSSNGSGTVVCVNSLDDLEPSGSSTVSLANYLGSIPADPQTTHDNSAFAAASSCVGGYNVVISNDATSVLISANMERDGGGNASVDANADGSTDTDLTALTANVADSALTAADFQSQIGNGADNQTATSQNDAFAVVVQG